ncbi:MAG: hypothetical protein K2N73_10550 [Lachnospiraceae bacterium]|nr:hypothetical protein [Lachnospiraceae bacterium]
MPKTKNGGFILDDSSCDPYGVVEMREKTKSGKQEKSKGEGKKSKAGKKK